MGCLNSEGQFDHWFANIHLSGQCNRACYFCIGQHMMALDPLDVLNKWPLPGWGKFITECKAKSIREVNLTGSNTDPLLYNYIAMLNLSLREELPGVKFGVRTNGVKLMGDRQDIYKQAFDKVSLSITSLDPDIYLKTMGIGAPPDLGKIMSLYGDKDVKINVVLCPENVSNGDFLETIRIASDYGINRVNLREPYGQPHIGNPLVGLACNIMTLGMPTYMVHDVEVTYWDVHYVEVESVNLYANGRVSLTYPVTKGHSPDGIVQGQEHFAKSGRVREQWL